MPDLLLLIGLPGSGKSTLAAKLAEQGTRRMLISTDAIRAQLYGDEAIQGSWQQIWRELQRQFGLAVQQIYQGQRDAAIYDATNVVRKQRREVLTLARSCGFTHISGIWLDVPLTVCLERNRGRDRQVPEAVIQRMYRRLYGAPPSLDEDLDVLIRYASFHQASCPGLVPSRWNPVER